MAYAFGDGFDTYATINDTVGYWDGALPSGALTLVAGRFTGSRALNVQAVAQNGNYFKNSGANDAVHHLNFATQQVSGLGGSNFGLYLALLDGATMQCSINFRSDGAIVLQTAPNSTVIDTYVGAITGQNVWTTFEIEVVIHNTAGSWTIRKNGNPSNDYTRTGLNTRAGTANNYANRLQIGTISFSGSLQYYVDDLYWRSDASSLTWLGDFRCYTRMPVADASVQFGKAPVTTFVQYSSGIANPAGLSAGNIRALPVTVPYSGTLTSLTYNFGTALTGHAKMALYTDVSGTPGALVAQSVELTNPGSGVNVFTITGGLTVTKGTIYWLAFWNDATFTANGGFFGATTNLVLAYTTSFPGTMAGFTTGGQQGMGSQGMNVVPLNASLVNEPQQDAGITYVYDGTPGHADFYNLGTIPAAPLSTIAVTTRGFIQKADAGVRSAAMQIKSGATTVASPTMLLTTSFQWSWRTDLVDPATGTAWTAAAVAAAQIGPVVVS